jgi:hypothetical protein
LHLEKPHTFPQEPTSLKDSLFGVTATIEEANESLLAFELSFFCHTTFNSVELQVYFMVESSRTNIPRMLGI